ncbi:transposase [Streptomyces sp. NPDC060035]|uniref:transposase n=1 Tax=Streptomyces sp. NPDC060035 TaxID=3347044 RepID=UPI00368407C3
MEPLLPVPTRSGRPSAGTERQLIDGIKRRVRVGAPWRDAPYCYVSWARQLAPVQAVPGGIDVPRIGAVRSPHGPTRPSALAPTAHTCADTASPAPFPNQRAIDNTEGAAAAAAAALPGSARMTTEPGTPSHADSTDSNATVPSPPDTTNSPSDTKPSSTSPSSTTGS